MRDARSTLRGARSLHFVSSITNRPQLTSEFIKGHQDNNNTAVSDLLRPAQLNVTTDALATASTSPSHQTTGSSWAHSIFCSMTQVQSRLGHKSIRLLFPWMVREQPGGTPPPPDAGEQQGARRPRWDATLVMLVYLGPYATPSRHLWSPTIGESTPPRYSSFLLLVYLGPWVRPPALHCVMTLLWRSGKCCFTR